MGIIAFVFFQEQITVTWPKIGIWPRLVTYVIHDDKHCFGMNKLGDDDYLSKASFTIIIITFADRYECRTNNFLDISCDLVKELSSFWRFIMWEKKQEKPSIVRWLHERLRDKLRNTHDVRGSFVQHLYNAGPTSKTLDRRCINVVQMFCVCWATN